MEISHRVTITGRILLEAGLPAPGALLHLLEVPLRGDRVALDAHAGIEPGPDGRYELTLDLTPFWQAGRARPHFALEVRRNDVTLQTREFSAAGSEHLQLDFVLSDPDEVADSQFEELRRRLQAYLPDAVEFGELTTEESARLASRSGLPSDRVQGLIAAERAAKGGAAPAAAYFAVGVGPGRGGLQPLATSAQTLADALDAAVEAGRVSRADLGESAKVIATRLADRAVDAWLEGAIDAPGAPWFRFVVDAAGLEEEDRKRLVQAGLRYGFSEDLWEALPKLGVEDPVIDRARAARDALQMAGGSDAVARRLLAIAPEPGAWAELDDAAIQALVTAEGDEALAVPATVVGDDDDERRVNWARLIARRIEDAQPARAFAAKALRSDDDVLVTAELRDLFERNGPVDVTAIEDVTVYVREQAQLAPDTDRDQLEAQLVRLRHLLALSPRFETARALRHEQLGSAYDVASMDFDTLDYRFGDELGRDEIERVHLNARVAAGLALNLEVEYRGNGAWFDTNVTTRPPPPEPTANLRSLFGATGFCDCEHCLSVLSPAAYLVDLLDLSRNLMPAEVGYRLGGNGEHVRFGAFFVTNRAVELSIALWVRKDGAWVPGQPLLSRAAAAADQQLDLHTFGADGLRFRIQLDGGAHTSSINGVLRPDTWHHVAIVRRRFGAGSRIEWWIDGQRVGVTGLPAAPTTVHAAPLRIGAAYPGAASFGPGRVAAVGIWTEALQEGHIHALHAAGTAFGRFTPAGAIPEPRFFLTPTPQDLRNFPGIRDQRGRLGTARDGMTVADVDVPDAQTSLRGRRPDLTELELSCDNTNVELPYLDLVNEHLEAAILAIKTGQAPAPVTATLGTAEERAVYPQQVIPPVYTQYLARASFPHDAIFDLWTAETRAYLQMAGRSRAEVMDALAAGPAPARLSGEATSFETLGLTARLAEALTEPAAIRSVDNWGYRVAWAQALPSLRNLGELLRRSGSEFDDMVELFQTRFVRAGGAGPVIRRPLGECDVDAMTIDGLTEAVAVRLQLMLRLRRAVGWHAFEVDRVLAAIAPGYPDLVDAAVNRGALVRLAQITRLAQRWSASPQWVAQLFADELDDHSYTRADATVDAGTFTQAFLQTSVSGQAANPLAALAPGATFADARDELLAGTSLDEASLQTLLPLVFGGARRLDAVPLDLANVTRLWSRARFARWADLPAADLVRSVRLTGIDPCARRAPVRALELLEHLERVQRSPLSVAEVSRLLLGGGDSRAAEAPEDRDLDTLLDTLRTSAPREPSPELTPADSAGDWADLVGRVDTFGAGLAAPLTSLLTDRVAHRSTWFPSAEIAPFRAQIPAWCAVEDQANDSRLVVVGLLLAGQANLLRALAAAAPAPGYLAAVDATQQAPVTALLGLRAQGLVFLEDAAIAALVAIPPEVDPAGNLSFEARRHTLQASLRLGEQVRAWLVDQLAEWTGLSPEAVGPISAYVRQVRRGAPVGPALAHLLEVGFGLRPAVEGRNTLARLLRIGRAFAALRFEASDVRWLTAQTGALAALPLRAPRSTERWVRFALGTRLDAGHVPLAGRTAFTVLLDIEPDNLALQSPFSILEQADAAAGRVDLSIAARDTGHLEVRVGGPGPAVTQGPVLQAGLRARVAVVYDGGSAARVRLFVDGAPAPLQPGAAPARIPDYPAGAARPPLAVSRDDNTGFTGAAHAIAVLDRALSAAEIAALHAERPVADLRSEPGLSLWLDMREGPTDPAGRTIIDESGSGRDGRFVAAAGLAIEGRGLPFPAAPASYAPFTTALALARVKAEVEKPDVSLAQAWLQPETSAHRERLADLLQISSVDLETLRAVYGSAYGAPAARDPESTLWMHRAAELIRGLSVSAERALRWFVGPAPAALDGAWTWPTQAVADDVRKVARARVDAATWFERAAPVRDELRIQQRDALVAYLTHDEQCVADPVVGSRTPEQLYGRLLIDNQMGPKVKSTRVVQAVSAVQLFLQRCGLNLEPFALTPSMRPRWTWMKNFRVWEANRKIFLYPENWLEPGLRDDKTPFFEALEGGLVEGPPSEAALEDLVATYLERLEEVADPEVMGMYHEVQVDSANVVVDRLHLVARTRGQPRRVFYRHKDLEWGPWEHLDVDMDPATRDVAPAVLRGRLFVFWFEFKAIPIDNRPAGAAGNYSIGRSETQLRARLAWTERRAGGWLPKRVSETAVEMPEFAYSLAPLTEGPDYSGQPNVQVSVADHIEVEVRITDEGAPWILGRIADQGTRQDAQFFFNRVHHELFGFEFAPVSGRVEAYSSRRSGSLQPAFYDFDPDPSLRWDYRGFFFHDVGVETITPAGALTPKGCAQEPTLTPRHPVALSGREGETLLVEAHIDRRPAPGAGTTGPQNARALHSDAVTVAPPTPSVLSSLSFEPGARTSLTLPANTMGPGSLPVRAGTIADFPPPDYGAPVTVWHMAHPFTAAFRSLLDMGGVRSLISRAGQHRASLLDVLQTNEIPGEHRTFAVVSPSWDMQFDPGLPYTPYNAELFLHIPLRVAEHLARDRRFEEALSWLHLVFDPTASAQETGTGRFWGFRPFRELEDNPGAHALLHALASNTNDPLTVARRDRVLAQIEAWLARPFRPFAIARLRPGAFQRGVVFAYLDLLIAWADDLFHQDTREAINEATQLYVLAAQILGERPQRVPQARFRARSYDELAAGVFQSAPQGLLDVLPTPGVRYVPPPYGLSGALGAAAVASVAKGALYFCIPPNPRLLRYWDTIEDRLFKIHNSLNIEGVERTLALFAPPIPPGLIARALASGLSLSEAIQLGQAVSRPRYRFRFMLRRAMELTAEVRGLGQQMLSALERRDGERVARMRAAQERDALELARRSRELSFTEASEQLESTRRGRDAVAHRQSFYRQRTPRIAKEERQIALIKSSQRLSMSAGLLESLASNLGIFPRMKAGAQGMSSPEATLAIGLQEIAGMLSGMARSLSHQAGVQSSQASIASTEASWERRDEEWRFQVEAADRELAQLDRQIAAAQLRVELARRAVAEHDAEMARSKDREEELRLKFSNEQLYDWMVKQSSGVYFQLYQLALEASRQAEAAFRYETGVLDATFLKAGYWDSLRKGLMAADELQLDLRRMELAQYDQDVRELEITKHISLALHAPDALRRLREGERGVLVDIPELLFDMDYPGHYRRRIRGVQLSLPTVTGPYASVNCTLTLESSSVRWTPQVSTAPDPQSIRVESIVTSSGVQDGMVDGTAEDGRYLPFEGAGVISRWRIDLPQSTNDFDLRDLRDVIVHLRYRARDGGPALRAEAEARVAALDRARIVSARSDLSNAWSIFKNPAPNAATSRLEFTLDRDTLPTSPRAVGVAISSLVAFVVPEGAPVDIPAAITAPGQAAVPLALQSAGPPAWATGAVPGPLDPGIWRLAVPAAQVAGMHDVLWIVTYADTF